MCWVTAPCTRWPSPMCFSVDWEELEWKLVGIDIIVQNSLLEFQLHFNIKYKLGKCLGMSTVKCNLSEYFIFTAKNIVLAGVKVCFVLTLQVCVGSVIAGISGGQYAISFHNWVRQYPRYTFHTYRKNHDAELCLLLFSKVRVRQTVHYTHSCCQGLH